MNRVLPLVPLIVAIALVAASPLRAEDAGKPAAGGAHDPHAQHGAHHGGHEALPGETPLPGLSVYQLDSPWRDAAGGERTLASLRGHPVLVLLFYGTCQSVCPVLVRDLQRIDEKIPEAPRADLRHLLVSFDPKVDTPERLAAYAKEHGLDPARWTLLHGSADQVRELAAVLGVRYRASGDGQYSHTQRITLLDREGRVVESFDGVARPIEPIAARVTKELEEGAATP